MTLSAVSHFPSRLILFGWTLKRTGSVFSVFFGSFIRKKVTKKDLQILQQYNTSAKHTNRQISQPHL
jgi:hypothetical protein